MKKHAFLFAVAFLAAFILLPGAGSGKYNVSKPTVADGGLIPTLPPSSSATPVADGTPIPPLPPNPTIGLYV